MADEIKATVSLTQALGLDKEAPKKGYPGTQAELQKGRIVDDFKVNNPERRVPHDPAPASQRP